MGPFGSSPLLEAGVVFTIPCCLVVGCLWVLAGAGCRLAAFVSTTVVGKIVSSRRGLVCMDSVPPTLNGDFGKNLVDPASSHMLVSKIKPCMSQYKLLHGETANGSFKQVSFIW